MVKALLLHDTSCDLIQVDAVVGYKRKEHLLKLLENEEYQEWLADRFFIFYLNRTRTYQSAVRDGGEAATPAAAGHILANKRIKVQRMASVDSRYIKFEDSLVRADSTQSDEKSF